MPLRLPSLNLDPVSLPRIGVGAPIKPRNPVLSAGQIGVPSIGSMVPQTPGIPTTIGGGDIGGPYDRPSFGGAPTESEPDRTSSPESPRIVTNPDGTPNWVAILAPLFGAGLGAAMGGGKMGALQGAAAGFAGVGQGMGKAAEIRRIAAETASELDIRESEAATRKAAVENEAAARRDALRQRKMEKAVALGIFSDLDPEDKAEAQKRYQDKKAADFSEHIGKIETAEELSPLEADVDRLLTKEDISPESAQFLKAQISGRETALKEVAEGRRLTRESLIESRISSVASREAEAIRLERESVEDRIRNVLPLVRSGMSYAHISKVVPDFTEPEYHEIRGQDIYDKTYEKVLDILSKNVMPGDEAGLDKAMKQADERAESARGKYLRDAMISDAVAVLKAIPEPERPAKLDQLNLSPAEKAEVARRLKLSWGAAIKPAVSDTTAVDNDLNALFSKKK